MSEVYQHLVGLADEYQLPGLWVYGRSCLDVPHAPGWFFLGYLSCK